MAKSYPIDISVPAGSRDPKLGDNDIRAFKDGVREILAVDHEVETTGNIFNSGDDEGKHAQVTLLEHSGDPTSAAGQGFIYTKDAGSDAIEEYYLDAAGNVIQRTKAGKMLLTKNIIANGSGIMSENFSGDTTLFLVKASGIDASGVDIVIVGKKPRAETATVSGDNTLAMTTKGYVDNLATGIGDSASKTIATQYQAATDGFLMIVATTSSGNPYDLTVLNDASNPPVTEIISVVLDSTTNLSEVITIPIKKSSYYIVNRENAAITATITWIPLGV